MNIYFKKIILKNKINNFFIIYYYFLNNNYIIDIVNLVFQIKKKQYHYDLDKKEEKSDNFNMKKDIIPQEYYYY